MGAIGALGVAAIGLVDIVGAPTGAQSADVRAELVSADGVNVALTGISTNPSISGAGDVVVFSNETPAIDELPAEHDLVVRKRSVGDTPAEVLLIDLNSPQPIIAALSGDGCTVAYSAMVDRPVVDPPAEEPPAAEPEPAPEPEPEPEPLHPEVVELRTLALCGAPGIEAATTVLDRVEGMTPLAAPALSSDGTTIVWPADDSVLAYAATSTPDVPDVIEISAPGAEFLIGGHLDISADGSIIVFEAGPLTADPEDAADEIAASVFITTIEPADVVTDPPVITTELFAPSADGSSWPTISSDGALVIYQSDQQLPIDGVPAEGDYLVIADRTVAPVGHQVLTTGAVRPDLSGDGTAVVYDVLGSVQIRRSDSTVPFAEFTEKIVNPKIDVEFDEGAADSVTGAVVSADGGVVAFDQPASVQLSTPILAGAHVWLQDAAPLFAPPPTSTTIDNTTTTTIAVTQPTVSVATTTPATTRVTTRNTTPNTTRTTPRSTTRATTTTTTVPLPVVFDPAAFDFAPTIINAGRRTASVDLFNPSAAPVTVVSIVVDVAGAADFTIDPTECTTLAAGARCAVGITFGPTTTGELTANVVATMSDATTATVALRGVGAPEPTMSVQPGVASNGQVITVFGSGFPAGASVDFDWNRGQVRSAILIDDVGGFSKTVIVLPNTASGPADIAVAGQVDLFGDVTATVLVSDSSSRGNTAVLGSSALGR